MSSEAIDVRRVSWHPERALQKVGAGARLGGERAALRVVGRADQIVPRDTGELADSVVVAIEGDEVGVGYRARHGVYVHAHPEWNFQGSGEADWLERALEDEAPSIGAEYAAAIRSEWG